MDPFYEMKGVSFNSYFTTEQHALAVQDFEMGADDIIVLGYPRTAGDLKRIGHAHIDVEELPQTITAGFENYDDVARTMWLQNIIYQLQYPDDDHPGKQFVLDRSLHLEVLRPGRTLDQYMKDLQSLPKPRMYKTHFTPSFLGEKILESNCKFLLLLRNPKDTLVSFYHFYRDLPLMGPFQGTWDEFFNDLVLQKKLIWGDWFEYVTEWSKVLPSMPNSLILRYEDLKAKPFEEVTKLAKFCGLNTSDSVVADIANRTGFAKSKETDSLGLRVAGYPGIDGTVILRRGEVGGWKEYFSQEQNDYVDEGLKLLEKETGLTFTM